MGLDLGLNIVEKDIILGIDPGLTGALALVGLGTQAIVDIIDVPTYQTKTKSRKSGKLSHIDLFSLSSKLSPYRGRIALCIIEEPGAMPGQGLGSTFKFGKVCGQLEGLIAGLGVPLYPIKPAVWKMALGLGSDKATTMNEIHKLYPTHKSIYFKRKKDHDRAEAVLLARFAIKHLSKFIDFCI